MITRTRTKIALLLALIAFLSSCAMSRVLYLGEERYAFDSDLQLPSYDAEDINGEFPETVYVKTRTQTFNAYHQYILRENRIWYKSRDPAMEPKEWAIFDKTGLPHSGKIGFRQTRGVQEISADADELAALSIEGTFYRYCFDTTIAHKSKVWLDTQGWPRSEVQKFDSRTVKNRSWAIGKRNTHVLYYEDPFGNQHHNGTMEIVTTYVLLDDGQEICYGDTGLPSDFSRNYLGPERGAFKAVSLSASASTMFLINDAGEMYTRLADFDTIGCDPMFFKYTYVPYKSDLPGTNYFSNLNEWGLPAEDWRSQPPIPLGGKAAITRHITILQNGQGNGARELRVAGRNELGETGYWTKAVFADIWEFKAAPLFFSDTAILPRSLSPDGNPRGERGASLDKHYSGALWNGRLKETGWEYAIPNFNMLEGDCDFRITYQGETCTLKLYPVEMWTYLRRDYLPGRTVFPKVWWASLKIPQDAFVGCSDSFVKKVQEKYGKNDRALFRYCIWASEHFLLMRESGDEERVLFLTDGALSREYPAFEQTQYLGSFEELRRYLSAELAPEGNASVRSADVSRKIEANTAFRDEVRYKIRKLKLEELTAFEFTFNYLPSLYVARFSPLRYVDVPKIRTITEFGDRVVLENAAFINTVAAVRRWVCEKLLSRVELRLRYLRDAAGETAPPWYSEDLADYYDRAQLPRKIAGTFFSRETGRGAEERPAVLAFDQIEGAAAVFGWHLKIGEEALFVDLLDSAKVIYERKGKSPAEKKLILDCVLYFKSAADKKDRGIPVRISCDDRTFEIREHPAGSGPRPLFRADFPAAPRPGGAV